MRQSLRIARILSLGANYDARFGVCATTIRCRRLRETPSNVGEFMVLMCVVVADFEVADRALQNLISDE
jgi:hypothetical protein